MALALAGAVAASASAAPRENSTDLYKKAASMALAGDVDQAIPIFQKTLQVNPSYCLAHYGLGRAYLNKPVLMDQAIIHLRKASQLDRRFAKAHFYLGMAYLFRKRYVEAAAGFKKAYEIDDTYIECLYNLGTVYEIMGNSFKSDYYFRMYVRAKKEEQKDVDLDF